MTFLATPQFVRMEQREDRRRSVPSLQSAIGLLGRPAVLARLEGAALLAAAVTFYRLSGGGWWMLAILFLAPDLSALGYLRGSTMGAISYNIGHTIVFPIAVGAFAFLSGSPAVVLIAAIWLAHIGWDRLIGYNLKEVPATSADPRDRASRATERVAGDLPKR